MHLSASNLVNIMVFEVFINYRVPLYFFHRLNTQKSSFIITPHVELPVFRNCIGLLIVHFQMREIQYVEMALHFFKCSTFSYPLTLSKQTKPRHTCGEELFNFVILINHFNNSNCWFTWITLWAVSLPHKIVFWYRYLDCWLSLC